eukprot:m.33122 g.33122  ORF g.33122 m.33122 type:complete len:229 (-) comp9580_c0_seq3:394-1080(-)
MALRERLESVTLRASRRWQPEDLKEAVARINARLSDVLDGKGRTLCFTLLNPETIEPTPRVLWRRRVLIEGRAVRGDVVLGRKHMTLSEFARLHDAVLEQIQTVSSLPIPVEDDYCCLCFETLATNVLRCSHRFCESCIENWRSECDERSSSATCPLCRETLASSSEDFIDVGLEEPSEREPSHVMVFLRHLESSVSADVLLKLSSWLSSGHSGGQAPVQGEQTQACT